MAHFRDLDRCFLGLAILIFVFMLLPEMIFPLGWVDVVIPTAVLVGVLVFVGCTLAVSIILLPLSLIFF